MSPEVAAQLVADYESGTPSTHLTMTYGIGALLLVHLRGDPDEPSRVRHLFQYGTDTDASPVPPPADDLDRLTSESGRTARDSRCHQLLSGSTRRRDQLVQHHTLDLLRRSRVLSCMLLRDLSARTHRQ